MDPYDDKSKEIVPFEVFSQAWTNRSHRAFRDEMLPAIKDYIVQMIAEGFTYKQIAENIGTTSDQVREWIRDDRVLAARCESAAEDITDSLEQAALRRAMEGTLKPVVSQGRVVMDPNDATKIFMVREYSDDLIKFLLKGRRRQTYGDKVETSNTNTNVNAEGVLDEFKRRIAAQSGGDGSSQPGSS